MLFIVLALSKTQWSTLVTGRYMIIMMVLLCYVNLSGMSLKHIVIVLMNNSLLDEQECTDSADVQQPGDNVIGRDRTAIIPRLNFTCNGRITNIRARVFFSSTRNDYLLFQVWRAASVGSTMYNKISEVELPPLVTSNNVANFDLTDNAMEVQSGDVVGYYHPSNARFRVITRGTDGYILYQFSGSPELVNLSNNIGNDDERQPLIQFTIGKFIV